jgi:hypothetical protein
VAAESERNERRTVHISTEALSRIRVEAERLDRSVSWVVRFAVEEGLAAVERLPSMERSQHQGAAE